MTVWQKVEFDRLLGTTARPSTDPQPPEPFPAWLPRVSPGWHWHWPHLVYLQRQLARVTSGELRRLVLTVPPRHGKTEMVTVRYSVYRLAHDPSLRVIIGAYNQSLAEKFGRKARRVAEGIIPLAPDRAAAGDWETTTGGGVRSVGVGAGITGQGGNLIIVDDPVKSREEAESETYRDRCWDWFKDDLYTRLEPGAAMIVILTRWHQDDLAGRLLAEMVAGGEAWEVLNLPALAEEGDRLNRAPGEALCPERYDPADLARIKGVLGSYSFSALYQGSPVPHEGGMFKWAWLNELLQARPVEVDARVRAWDPAGSEGRGDYTAGVLMSRTREGLFVVEDCTRGQWSPAQRDAMIRATAERDGPEVDIWLEAETGVAGADRTLATIRGLAGYNVRSERVTGDKTHRAEPFAAQAEAGNVRVVAGPWLHAWREELCGFPSGAHDDAVDATSAAFAKLADAAGWTFY